MVHAFFLDSKPNRDSVLMINVPGWDLPWVYEKDLRVKSVGTVLADDFFLTDLMDGRIYES